MLPMQIKSISLHGFLKRLKDINAYRLWLQLKEDANFMAYFPDSCYKKVPDRDYFWRVLGVTMPTEYQNFLRHKISFFRERKRIKEDKLLLSREARDIFEDFQFEDKLSLLSFLTS